MNIIFNYNKAYYTIDKCIRCGGTGSANIFTYPDQSYKNGCKLCGGTGKLKLLNVPVLQKD